MKKTTILLVLFSCINAYSQEQFNPFMFRLPSTEPEGFYHIKEEIESKEINPTNELQDNYYTDQKTKGPKNGKLYSTIFFLNKSFRSESTFKNGLLDGIKYIYHKEGTIFQEITFLKGKMNGIYKIYDYNGNLHLETNYKNDVKHGKRKYYPKPHRPEEYFEGNYTNGVLDNTILLHQYDNVLHYPNDMNKGIVKVYNNSILFFEMPIYKQTSLHGTAKEYDPKTKNIKSSVDYVYGEAHGYHQYYDQNGNVTKKSQYAFGKPVGEHKSYASPDKLSSEKYYDEIGNKIGTWKEYDVNGQITSIANYAKDSLHGEQSSFYKGKLRKTESYKNGMILYSQSFSDKSDKPIAQTFYSNGKYQLINEYTNSGLLFTKSEYNDGKIISRKYFDKQENIIYENKYKENQIAYGIHRIYIYDKEENLSIMNEMEYDTKGQEIKKTYYNSSGYYESRYLKYQRHGLQVQYDKKIDTKTESYYYKDKKVTKEEFEKLSSDE